MLVIGAVLLPSMTKYYRGALKSVYEGGRWSPLHFSELSQKSSHSLTSQIQLLGHVRFVENPKAVLRMNDRIPFMPEFHKIRPFLALKGTKIAMAAMRFDPLFNAVFYSGRGTR